MTILHPEVLRELARLRQQDLLAQAQTYRLIKRARLLRHTSRAETGRTFDPPVPAMNASACTRPIAP